MTTTVTKSIGSGGGRDYSTIASWMSACPSDLVAVDQIWRGELYNDSEFYNGSSGFSFTNVNCDGTRYVQLTTGAGQSFRDSAFAVTSYSTSNGVGLMCAGGYATLIFVQNIIIEISNVQLYYNSSYGGGYYPIYRYSGWLTLRNCVYQSNRPANQIAGSMDLAVNCIFNQRANGGYIGASWDGQFRNCTFVTPTDLGAYTGGLTTSYGHRPTSYNCAFFGMGWNVSDASFPGDYNAADNGGYMPTGSNEWPSLTTANEIENSTDASLNVRPKSGSTISNSGTRDASYTGDLDIMGNARSTTTPSIGAFEYVAGGGGGSIEAFERVRVSSRPFVNNTGA